MQQKEAKLEELYEQMSAVERERTRLRDTVINYEEENRNLVATLEESKIEVQELKKHIEIYENKQSQQSSFREEKLNTHISTIKELEMDIASLTKRNKDLNKEKEAQDNRAQEELSNLREELYLSKEKVL